jgi:hypothetical protein
LLKEGILLERSFQFVYTFVKVQDFTQNLINKKYYNDFPFLRGIVVVLAAPITEIATR